MEQYVSTEEVSHLLPSNDKNAAHYGDRMLVFAEQIPGGDLEGSIENIQDTVRSVRGVAAQNLRRLREDAQSAKKKAEKATSEAQGQIDQLKQEADIAREEFESNAQSRLSELQQEIDNQGERIGDLRDRFETEFDKAQSKRDEQFEDKIETWKSQFGEAISETRGRATEILEEMEKNKEKVERLTGVIGASGRAGGFKKQADYEREEADRWRERSMYAMYGLIIASAWFVAEAILFPDLFGWAGTAGKVTLLGAISAVAGYSARQGQHHIKRAEINRQLELELTSIRPYLAGFPDAEERAILTEFAGRWFGNIPAQALPEEESAIDVAKRMSEDAVRRGQVEEESGE